MTDGLVGRGRSEKGPSLKGQGPLPDHERSHSSQGRLPLTSPPAHRRNHPADRSCFVENRDDALDLAQDVFVKAFEHLPTFRRESRFKTWLYRIAINHCLNHVKKHSQQFVEVTEFTASVRPAVQHQLEHEEQRQHFRRLVKRLPPKQKAILELRINEQLSYEEIAQISGRSVSTIKASVFFALEKLRKLVKDPGK